jgi:hypothetical protein
MEGKGIRAEKVQIDWPELMSFERSFTEPVTKRREFMASLNVATIERCNQCAHESELQTRVMQRKKKLLPTPLPPSLSAMFLPCRTLRSRERVRELARSDSGGNPCCVFSPAIG